ncbi:MAG: polysaccharide deacetylase family protein [Oleiphilaceae bacterium]|nr:polysaccharide deacetylase family protein [Oleiphilaceae bacterium]
MHYPSPSARPTVGLPYRGLPVLMYHHISPIPGPYTVHPERFRAQLRWLKKAGYQCLGARELLAYHQGRTPLPGRSVVLSFDDGWLDNWVYAVPVLRSEGFRALLFVVTGWPCDGPARSGEESAASVADADHDRCMSLAGNPQQRDSVVMRWSELRAARKQGVFDLECHSHSHGLWWQNPHRDRIHRALEEDLALSRETFHRQLGAEPQQFCWPRGQFTPAMGRLAHKAGFSLQHSTLRGCNPGDCEHRVVRRLNVEDRPLSWFRRRVRFYSRPWLSALPALAHQHLQARRLRQQLGDRLNRSDLAASPFRLV